MRFLNHSKASLSLAKGPTRFVPVNTVLYQDRMAMDALGKRAGAASRSIRFRCFHVALLGGEGWGRAGRGPDLHTRGRPVCRSRM